MDTVNAASREEARDALGGMYMHGRCSALAIAVSRRTGWSLVALWKGSDLLHSGCRRPDGRIVHAHGIVPEEEFTQGWGGVLRECGEEEMLSAHPQSEDLIRKAALHADMMFDLPGRCAELDAYAAFAVELAELCERHGIYLRGHMPSGAGIVAYPSYGDEVGFAIEPQITDCVGIVRRLA